MVSVFAFLSFENEGGHYCVLSMGMCEGGYQQLK